MLGMWLLKEGPKIRIQMLISVSNSKFKIEFFLNQEVENGKNRMDNAPSGRGVNMIEARFASRNLARTS
jgi:hypothetical protein